MSVTAQTITRTDLRVYSFTRDHVVSDNADHVFSHSPTAAIFLSESLGDFGGVRGSGSGKITQTGGASVMGRVRLGAHAGSKRMSGPFDTHSVAPDDNTRMSEANWTHYSGALVVSDYDKGVNQGPEAMASFIEDQTVEVRHSLVDVVTGDLWATTGAPNAVTSFDTLISAGAASVMTLSGTTYDNWNARGLSDRGTAAASISFTSGSFASQGIADMRTCYNNASEGSIQPTAILTEYATHERYEGALQPQERFQGAVNVADGSFGALAFRTKPVMADPKCSSGTLYMVRAGMDGLQVKVLGGFDFGFADFKPGSNQETWVSELQFKGQTFIRNRRFGNNKMNTISD